MDSRKQTVIFSGQKKDRLFTQPVFRAPEKIRTPDTTVRSRMLYPAELLTPIGWLRFLRSLNSTEFTTFFPFCQLLFYFFLFFYFSAQRLIWSSKSTRPVPSRMCPIPAAPETAAWIPEGNGVPRTWRIPRTASIRTVRFSPIW